MRAVDTCLSPRVVRLQNMFIFILCVSILPVHVSVYHMCAMTFETKGGPWSLWNWITEGCEPLGRCWESNLGRLEEQSVLLTA